MDQKPATLSYSTLLKLTLHGRLRTVKKAEATLLISTILKNASKRENVVRKRMILYTITKNGPCTSYVLNYYNK